MEPSFEIETITPERARRLLQNNTGNRRLREDTVAKYASDMRAGRWLLTGAPVLLNGSGVVYDGQHRLAACIKAQKPFTTVVGRGLTEAVKPAIDSGLKRTFADILRWRGASHAAGLSALVYFCWRYDNELLFSSRYPSHAEGLSWLESNNEQALKSVKVGALARLNVPVPQTAIAVSHFLTARLDEEAADEFFAALTSGAELREGSSILVVQRWINRWAAKRDRPSTLIYAATLLKALNAYRSGAASTKIIKIAKDEPFPRVWGEA